MGVVLTSMLFLWHTTDMEEFESVSEVSWSYWNRFLIRGFLMVCTCMYSTVHAGLPIYLKVTIVSGYKI